MIILKTRDKAIEEIFAFWKIKMYSVVAERRETWGAEGHPSEEATSELGCKGWLLDDRRKESFQAEAAVYKKGPVTTLGKEPFDLTHREYSQKANNFFIINAGYWPFKEHEIHSFLSECPPWAEERGLWGIRKEGWVVPCLGKLQDCSHLSWVTGSCCLEGTLE